MLHLTFFKGQLPGRVENSDEKGDSNAHPTSIDFVGKIYKEKRHPIMKKTIMSHDKPRK